MIDHEDNAKKKRKIVKTLINLHKNNLKVMLIIGGVVNPNIKLLPLNI